MDPCPQCGKPPITMGESFRQIDASTLFDIFNPFKVKPQKPPTLRIACRSCGTKLKGNSGTVLLPLVHIAALFVCTMIPMFILIFDYYKPVHFAVMIGSICLLYLVAWKAGGYRIDSGSAQDSIGHEK